MLNDCLNHTDREEDWIQGFQSLMGCKNDYHKLMLLFDPFSPGSLRLYLEQIATEMKPTSKVCLYPG